MYRAAIVKELEFSSGWKYCRVGIFKVTGGKEEQIGEYERNYPSLFNTFFPFQRNGKDLALYSPNYTVTRIMELPSCKDIGGEEPHGMGFCPVDYFVPTYIEQEIVSQTDNPALPGRKVDRTEINNPAEDLLSESTHRYTYEDHNTMRKYENVRTYIPLTPLLYRPFGFVAGCIWGDDSTYKIQFLDLENANEGLLKRDERFGYLELGEGLRLKDAIDMYDYGYDRDDKVANYIRISTMQTFDLGTGKVVV